MTDENINDQLVTVSKLARLLAKDNSFVCEIGLDEFQPHEVVQRLEIIISFVLAMYNAAKTIFRRHKTMTLDDKFIQLIHSRVVVIPEIVLSQPDTLNYARECYNEVKRDADQSQHKWNTMPLYTQFFYICVHVFIEELKSDRPDIHLSLPDLEKISSVSVLTCAFKAIFSHINWELDDIAVEVEPKHVEPKHKVILSPKKAPGPDSRLKDHPLLYLYFDNFAEITRVWKKGHFEAARHNSDIRSCRFSLDQIMNDENLFLDLYEKDLLRLKLHDGTHIVKRDEDLYWDRVTHPEKHKNQLWRNKEIAEHARKLEEEISTIVEAIKLRYGL